MIRLIRTGGIIGLVVLLIPILVPLAAFVAIGLIMERRRKIRPCDGN